MSMNLNAVYIEQFDSEVKMAYQGEGNSLRSTVRLKTGIVGKSTNFPKSGKGLARKHIQGNDTVPMNNKYDTVQCNLTDWDADDYSDIFSQQKVNFDEIKILASNASMAIHRKEDQLIIDSVEASAGTSVGSNTTAFNTELVSKVARVLNDNNVPDEDRVIVWSPAHMQALLNETKPTSTDFNSVQALVGGNMKEWYGFTFKRIGNREEGGLKKPVATAQNFYAYHKHAVGLAIGIDLKTSVDWIAEKKAWLVGCSYSAGAVAIDDEGIVKGVSLITAS